MSHCVEKLPHSCGSSNGLQVFETEGKYDGFCFACNKYISEPYGTESEKVRTKGSRVERPAEDVAAELEAISAYPVIQLGQRKLSEEALRYFHIRVGVSEQDGTTPTTVHFPYYTDRGRLVAYKSRLLVPKKMWCVGNIQEATFFGWQQALASGGKRLFITEGEFDAVALYQALKDQSRGTKWEHLVPAVISLKNGAGSARKAITDKLSEIRHSFKEVVLVFDNDDAGKAAQQDVLQVLPTARVVQLPAKDANDCIIQGRSKALANAVLFKAETPKNTRLVWAPSLYTEAREVAQWGLSWPWKGLTEATRGIRFGETYYIGAGVKMGKSELVNSLASDLMITHGLKVFMAKPEEANKKTIKMVLGKVAGRIFHDPTVEFDYEAYDKAAQLVGDKLCMLSLYQHLGWESLRADILVAAAAGCKAVFIDPITNLVNGITSGETNTILQEIAQELAALAKDLDIVVFIFCHLKAPTSGEPHERGGKVYSHQFSGSRAMMRSCNLMLGLEGDKNPDASLEERNMRRLVILEDREFGASGFIRLYWDKQTGLFNEIMEE